MSKRFFGCHCSTSGGLENGLKNGDLFEVNTIQVHASPPQRWNFKPFPPGYEAAFLQYKKESKVEKVFFHGIYLINLANPDPQQSNNSRLSLIHALDLSARIRGEGVIFHVGSMKHQEDEQLGYKHAADNINIIMEKSDPESRLLLEVAAGSGSIIGDRVEELSEIYAHVEQKERVGFALDTQHLWASGYDLQNNLEDIVKNIEAAFTIEKVWAIHLNDSKTALGSKTDRHENIGDGLIGKDALANFINHPKLEHIPVILETPALKDPASTKAEVEKVRVILA